MKYLKTYEQNINEPQVGDYVITTPTAFTDRIGIIININHQRKTIDVQFQGLACFLFKEIEFYSTNKEDCETYISAKKYNL
jgi:transcription antitermination factor NusG